MSAFREWLEALGRLERALAPEPGPALLPWAAAKLVPVSEVAQPDVRRRIEGALYGREFTVWFPAREAQPAGHVWVLATWSAETSGTHRPEVLAACRTCTDASHERMGTTGVIVGPAACVLRASEVDAAYARDGQRTAWLDEDAVVDALRDEARSGEFRRQFLNRDTDHGDPWPGADR